MSDDPKLPVARRATAVTRVALGDLPTTLPSTSGAWFGSRTYVTKKDAEFVEAHTRLLTARGAQCDALNELIEKRIALGVKIADLHNVLAEHQRVRDHQRWQAERKRQHERVQADYDDVIAVARNEAELDRAREATVRAQRNREAAERVKQSEIDAWYHAAEARRHNAVAESQDTAADLARVPSQPPSDAAIQHAADSQRAHALAVLDNQLDMERQRGNDAAVLALLNLKARLSARWSPCPFCGKPYAATSRPFVLRNMRASIRPLRVAVADRQCPSPSNRTSPSSRLGMIKTVGQSISTTKRACDTCG